MLEAFGRSDHPHIQFTPRDVTAWIEGLQKYSLEDLDFWAAVAHEGCRIFRDKLVGPEARSAFDSILVTVLKAQVRAGRDGLRDGVWWCGNTFDYGKGSTEMKMAALAMHTGVNACHTFLYYHCCQSECLITASMSSFVPAGPAHQPGRPAVQHAGHLGAGPPER